MDFKTLLVFDTETVPDAEHHSGQKFPKVLFHQVVAISFVEVALGRKDGLELHKLHEIRSGGEASFTEAQLLEGFFQYVELERHPCFESLHGEERFQRMMDGVKARVEEMRRQVDAMEAGG